MNERTSETGEAWQKEVSPSTWSNGSAASWTVSASPSAPRHACTAPGTTGLSGASSGFAVQRSPLPRIQVASGSACSSATQSSGQPPNSA